MTTAQTRRRRIATLERRAAFLAARISNYEGGSDSRDRAELAALNWALVELKPPPPQPQGGVIIR
jgi:hypothetical protein